MMSGVRPIGLAESSQESALLDADPDRKPVRGQDDEREDGEPVAEGHTSAGQGQQETGVRRCRTQRYGPRSITVCPAVNPARRR